MNFERLTYGLILFLINPIVSVLASIRNFRIPESKIFLILFFALFGMTMNFDEGKDGYRHAEKLKSYEHKDFKKFIKESQNIILLKSNQNEIGANADMYLHVLSYIVAPWSTGTSGLYFFAALIYGFFFISGIRKVFLTVEGNWNSTLYFLFFVFIFWKSFEGINSIRNWTAAWIYFNGAFSYFQTKEKKYVLLVLLSPLFHFGYAIITLPFFIVFFLGNRPKLFIGFLILSFLVSFSDISLIKELFSFSELGERKAASYVREGAAESYLIDRGGGSFHSNYYLIAGKIFVSVLFYYAILAMGYFSKNKHTYLTLSLASVAILTISFSNLSTLIFALYSRLFNNAGLFILTYLILIINYDTLNKLNEKRMVVFNSLLIILIPFAILFVFTQWSQIGEFADMRIFVSPLVYFFIGEDAMLVKEFLKDLFLNNQ